MSSVVIFHKNCFDGICSAWVASKKLGPGTTFYPMAYGEPISDILKFLQKKDEVYFIDFSLPKTGLKIVANQVEKIIVLDHHKTAEAELKDFAHPNAEIIFDMNKSGAQLAWDYFFEEYRPALIDYVGDRDLWRFALPESEYINAYIQSFPMSIEAYDMLNHEFDTIGLNMAIVGGKAITRYKNECVERICKAANMTSIGGHNVPSVNTSILFSEVAHRLCELNPDKPFADAWFIRSDKKIQHSLRSIGDFDVSAIAKQFGGGGHKNAAGFEDDFEEE